MSERGKKRGEEKDEKASSAQYTHSQTTPTTGDVLVLVLSNTVKVPINIHRNKENDVLEINHHKFSTIPLEVCRGVLYTFNIVGAFLSKHAVLRLCVICLLVVVVCI